MGSHCLPKGYLGTGETPVPSVPGGGSPLLIPTGGLGSSNVRGVVVFLHGLALQGAPFPATLTDTTSGYGSNYVLTTANNLVADGWIFVLPIFGEDAFAPTAHSGVYNDLSNDTTKGARYMAMTGRWWDHIVAWVQLTFGSLPIVPFGASWGAHHACYIAANKTSTIAGFVAHEPAMQVSQTNLTYTTPVDFCQSPTTTTIAAGSNGAVLPQTSISVASTTGFAASGEIRVTNNAGGYSVIYYTGTSGGNTFTGCLGGAGTLATGGTVAQSTFTSGMDLTTTYLNGVTTIPGIIGWSTSDIAVGYGMQQAMYTAAHGVNSTITSWSEATPHGLSLAAANNYTQATTGYFATTIDPLCPKKY